MPKEVTYIRLEPEIKQALERTAKADGRSLSALIAKIAGDWVKALGAAKGPRR